MYEIILGRTKEDREKFGLQGTVFLGKQYVKMGRTTSLANEVYLDVVKSHVVFICGKRGSGKCLHGDTLVTLSNGDMVPIRELAYTQKKFFGLDHRLKIVPVKREGFYEREVNRILNIKLRSGKEINLTPEHPLLTVMGWVEAKDLSKGSRIATPRKIDAFGSESMQECEVKLLAYLIAEGHTGKKIFFTNADKTIIADFEHSLLQFDKSLRLKCMKKGQYDIVSTKKRKLISAVRDYKGRFLSIYPEKSRIRAMLELNGIYKVLSKNKFLSDKILKLSKNRLALFLNRLFSCDGSIYGKPWQISYSSSSEKLIRQIQSLLLRFGILSKLRNKKVSYNSRFFDSYEIVLSSGNVRKFIQQIGFFGEKENRQILALKELENISENPNVDTVPKGLWDIYRPKSWASVGKEMGYSTPKAARSSISYSVSRQKLLQVAMADNNERIRLLAESDIFWDEIVSIREISGCFKVYDTTIPNLHNFVANDIIVHNSYSMGVIAEGISDLPKELRENLGVVILDTMGIYWTMKYANQKDIDLLDEWKLKGKALDVQIFTPVGYYEKYKEKGIPTDFPFSIKPSELDAADWCTIFEIKLTDSIGVLIERVISRMKETKQNFVIDDIIKEIQKDEKTTADIKNAAENRFVNTKNWGLFSKEGTLLKDIVKPGQISVLDVSAYVTIAGARGARALVIGLVAQKLFIERMIARKEEEYEEVHSAVSFLEQKKKKKRIPLVWFIIDEAHEFLPNEGKTVATDALVTILREGRQPGISLILASQQPGRIHTDVMTQSDIVISHTITAKIDTEALSLLTQTYMREGLDQSLSVLPKVSGSAIVLDDANERIFPMKIRPRFTWHGGAAPTALPEKEKETFEL